MGVVTQIIIEQLSCSNFFRLAVYIFCTSLIETPEQSVKYYRTYYAYKKVDNSQQTPLL